MLSSPTERLRSVHSSQQRMLFYEPEDGFFWHATIDLAKLPHKEKSHVRSSSHSSANSNHALGTSNDEGLEDEALLAGLRDLYEQFRLFNGSLANLVAEEGRDGLAKRLTTYFDRVLWQWHLEEAVLGVCDFAKVLGALPASPALSSIAALPPNLRAHSEQCILLDHDEILHTPEDPALRPLLRHLCRQQPKRSKAHPTDTRPSKTSAPVGQSAASKWTLGLSDYLSANVKPETDEKLAEKPEVDFKNAQNRSWLRAVSWGQKSKTADEEPEVKAAVQQAAEDSDDSSIAEHIARQAADSSTDDISKNAAAGMEDIDCPPEEAIETSARDEKALDSVSDPNAQLRVYVGDQWLDVRLSKRNHVLLAICSGILHNTTPPTDALLEEAEGWVNASTAIPAASTYRHLLHDRHRGLQRSLDWPAAEEAWSGNKRSAKEADVIGSLLDFAFDPQLEESLVRTGSGHWAAARRATAGNAADAYLVLPRRFGRDAAEGSLLDAAHELNARLGRAVL